MRAAQLRRVANIEEEPLEITNLPDPHPHEEEIRIKIRTCGICHTDLHIVEGELELPKLPIVPGHEIVGVVDEVGEEVVHFKKGDRVGVPWLYSTCGGCEFCKKGMENLCERAKFTGLHVDGGFSEYIVVNENFAYPIPDVFSDEHAAPLLCAGVIGYRALRLSEVKPGERLGLYGFGASAHIVIQIAIHWGCETYVFTRSEEHRKLARELGAAWVGGPKDEPPKKINSGIIFAPAGWIVKEALRVMEKGGTLALAGIYMSPIPEIPYQMIYHERKVRSVANSTREDVKELLRVAAEIPIRTEVEVFPFEDVNKAMKLLKDAKINGAGVLKIS
ncbi:MAG: zinc-dependent alcohol dehydrogenase family protein [Candidatus Methanospirareceae archaeon]